MSAIQNIYGVTLSGVHHDVSDSEKAAKRFASINGHDTVSVRYGGGYVACVCAKKIHKRWVPVSNGEIVWRSEAEKSPACSMVLNLIEKGVSLDGAINRVVSEGYAGAKSADSLKKEVNKFI